MDADVDVAGSAGDGPVAYGLSAQIAVGVSIRVGPPAIPVYEQPPCPQEGYLWTPGYWAYGEAGYYWVPGVWVAAPRPGFLWTPGYWGWNRRPVLAGMPATGVHTSDFMAA